jgi:aspartate/methionine/tyrosine aminotransferase
MMNDNNIKYHKNNGLPKLREKVINWLKQDENNYNLVYKKNKKNNLIYNI